MTSTATLRRLWPDLVKSQTGPVCDYRSAVAVPFAAGAAFPAGRVLLRFHPAAAQAARALAATFLAFGYTFDEAAGGTLNCRLITGGAGTSLHAHGIALDINPSRNGYRRTAGHLDDPDTGHAEGILQWGRFSDMPAKLVRAVEGIKTAAGVPVWGWGGRWFNIKDPMHYQLEQSPAVLAAGIDLATVPGWAAYLKWAAPATATEGDPVLDRKSPRPSAAVATAQADLIALGFKLGDFPPFAAGYPVGADGFFGDSTEAAAKAFQRAMALPETGTIDATTLAVLVRAALRTAGGADTSKLATKAELAAHAKSPASADIHPHGHRPSPPAP